MKKKKDKSRLLTVSVVSFLLLVFVVGFIYGLSSAEFDFSVTVSVLKIFVKAVPSRAVANKQKCFFEALVSVGHNRIFVDRK